MFIFSYRGVITVLLVCALLLSLLASGQAAAAKPWIDGALIALIAFVFIRIWLK
jgi:hypothetical protein